MRSSNDSSSSELRRGSLATAVVQMTTVARVVTLAWILALSGWASELRADPVSIDTPPSSFAELLDGFSKMTGLEARFEEEKYLALLAVPLRSSGHLYFSPPSTLLRRVEEPRAQDVLVIDDQVRIRDDSGEQTIDLGARGEVRPLVESMLWILGGDLESLERTYRVDYEVVHDPRDDATRVPRWRITLVPRGEPLSQLISALEVSGRGRVADTLELRETSGDRTLTRILDANPMRRFDPAERRDLFGGTHSKEGSR